MQLYSPVQTNNPAALMMCLPASVILNVCCQCWYVWGSLTKNIQQSDRTIGDIFHADLCFDAEMNNVQSCFFQHISNIRSFLSPIYFYKVMLAFIFSHLNYCISFYDSISQRSHHQLRLVQNTAVYIWTGTKRYWHITTKLANLPLAASYIPH